MSTYIFYGINKYKWFLIYQTIHRVFKSLKHKKIIILDIPNKPRIIKKN